MGRIFQAMVIGFRISSLLFFSLCWIGLRSPVTAQDSASSPSNPPAVPSTSGEVAADPGVIEKQIAELEANSSLDDATRKILKDRYEEALDALKKADGFRSQEKEYREAIQKGPEETKRIRTEIEKLKADPESTRLPPNLNESTASEAVATALASEEAALASLKSQRQELAKKQGSIKSHSSSSSERLTAAEAELLSITAELDRSAQESATDETNPSAKATQEKLRATRESLEAEIAMLKQEDLSADVRSAWLTATLDLQDTKIDRLEQKVAKIANLVDARAQDAVSQAERLLARLKPNSENFPDEAKNRIEEVERLVSKSRDVAKGIADTDKLLSLREAELKQITEAYERLKEQLGHSDLEGSMAPLLLEQIRNLPAPSQSKARLAKTRENLATARSGFFELDQAQKVSSPPTPGLEKPGGVRPAPQDNETTSADIQKEIESLQEISLSLRTALRAGYERWIRSLGSLDSTNRKILSISSQYRDFGGEKLFWVKSSPIIGPDTFRSLPGALRYCFGLERIKELKIWATEVPAAYWIFSGILLLGFLLPRKLFRHWLIESGKRTRRISTDSYTHTVVAFVATLLLAIPLPLAFAIIGVGLMSFGRLNLTDWGYGLSTSVMALSQIFFHIFILTGLCKRNGLGEVHFRWSRSILDRVRRLTLWYIPFYLFAGVTIFLVLHERTGVYLDGLGRLSGLLFVSAGGVLLALLMHPERGIASVTHRHTPKSIFGRLRYFWFWSVVALAASLVFLLLAGFVLTSFMLVDQIEKSISAIVIACVAYGLILRWFAIRERRLALQELKKKRQERQEASRQQAASADSTAEESRIPEIKEEEEPALSEVSGQTRRLIAFLVGIGLLVHIFLNWTAFQPIVGVLDRYQTLAGLSLADLGFSFLVITIVLVTIRNLPGLLEITVLRHLELDAGTRNAITTLANYCVIAAGSVILFKNLGADWAQFGWIAAALSVGLGFGLQEVVANFISGIILLFERPIRVGDIVSVDGIDGVVSRIRIRATTITNWDRKEFIVPNKQFVTGTLLNWTLSNTVNRIVIVVGAAYGTDTEKALEVLEKVAKDHPLIMDDPAPLVSFEEFGDSALKLVLRCYLPDMDQRLRTISELHTAVDKAFKEAGIEIAFPQLDVHLRKDS